jgi:hypothetical protein
MTRALSWVLVIGLVLGLPGPARAYQTYGVRAGGRVVVLKWSQQPVRYYITDQGVAGVSPDQFRTAAERAFSTWQGVQGSGAVAQFVGFTSADPFEDDGRPTLGFLSRPDLDRVLGATSFLVDNVTGEIVEADIFLNSSFPWSVASGGESGRYDVESIILHEAGHLFGLGHSGLGETELRAGGGRRVIASEAVMFPIAFSAGNINGRGLRPDDIAGLRELYPEGGIAGDTGAISGRVTKNGQPVIGAHVVAFNPQTGSLVGNFTVDEQGSFSISGLEPGPHVIRVEPIDDADLDSYFDDPFIPQVDVNFKVTYHDRLVVVPKGGGAQSIEIKVVPK